MKPQHRRNWHDLHREAGYHLQKWGPVPTPNSELVGTYECVHHGVPMLVTVRHLPAGPTGAPELEIEWEDGMKVTVLDEATALEYLIRDQAATVES